MKKITITLSALILSLTILFASPGWKRVNYTSSTIFTGIVTVDSQPASEGDFIGVFVGNECRMVAKVFVKDQTAYVSSVLHGETLGEQAVIKYWSAAEDKIYDVDGAVSIKPEGEISLLEINVVTKKPIVTGFGNDFEKGKSDYLSVFPVPAKDEVHAESLLSIKSATIFNQLGQPVVSLGEAIPSSKLTLSLDGLDAGVYFLSVTLADGQVLTKKIIKDKEEE